MIRLTTGFLGLIVLLSLISCGDEGGYNMNSHLHKPGYCTIEGTLITCPDGNSIDILNGKDDLSDKTGTVVTTTNVETGMCEQIYPGIWAENIYSGEIFDVYMNDVCSDSLGEYCDNVQPSYGSSGDIGPNETGNGTVCLALNYMVVGKKLANDSIDVSVIDFTGGNDE